MNFQRQKGFRHFFLATPNVVITVSSTPKSASVCHLYLTASELRWRIG